MLNNPWSRLGPMAVLACALMQTGCGKPEGWAWSGPRVYLIRGDGLDDSDGLDVIRDELTARQVNARTYGPGNWLQIITEIDAAPREEAILVGHGHGAFLATQVARHYAQRGNGKFIEAVIALDAYNKDWPHTACEAGFREPHSKPAPIPISHSVLRVRNFNQSNPDSRRWGADLVSTRGSNIANTHPFCWYDNWWNGRGVTGQLLSQEVTNEGIWHETIDNDAEVIERVIQLCRRAALSPFHYTPPEHHPMVMPAGGGDQDTQTGKTAA
jgi:hypothetical protein